MGGLSIWHILAIAAVALLLFGGRGRVSDIMGDFAKGIRNFRKGLSDDDDHQHPQQIPDERRDMNKDTAQHS
jgi:sec-independent protein translocase protein TatA